MDQNLIIAELERRKDGAEGKSLASRLSVLVGRIVDAAADHQKRVAYVMPEFDLHDEKHLAMVLENMSCLIGKERVASLSDVELFLLIAAAYLHDCGMAPAEWELRLMQLTEGTDEHTDCEESFRNDGKPPFNFSTAKKYIEKNKTNI